MEPHPCTNQRTGEMKSTGHPSWKGRGQPRPSACWGLRVGALSSWNVLVRLFWEVAVRPARSCALCLFSPSPVTVAVPRGPFSPDCCLASSLALFSTLAPLQLSLRPKQPGYITISPTDRSVFAHRTGSTFITEQQVPLDLAPAWSFSLIPSLADLLLFTPLSSPGGPCTCQVPGLAGSSHLRMAPASHLSDLSSKSEQKDLPGYLP